ncbi:hypothetical protein C7M84_017183 [Penaeus vannamei]|uniref:Uncharacterized protein n=1 Tax=Penaeus vannamei TaxID=6689 RepID=A0A423SKX1_PENVA|nr:hypothetical protein C7M84_017183 [Penaeus vannamei]
MGTLTAPVRYNSAPSRDQLGCLPEVGHPLRARHHSRSSMSSYCSEVEWHRSASPAASTHSGHSSPSEIGDSGVCSEHDTPPPVSRYPARSARIATHVLDSDSESNLSSDSLPESYREEAKGDRPRQSPRTSGSRRGRANAPSVGGKASLPEALLDEIREKWQELQQRRAQYGRLDGAGPERGHAGRSGSQHQWSAGRHSVQRRSCPASPSLSRASSNFPSSLSLFEEDLDASRASPVFLEGGWRPLNVSMSPGRHHDDGHFLYECRDDAAGQGFAGLRDIFSPQQESTIKSHKGTVRGVKNRVRAGIATFTSDQRILKPPRPSHDPPLLFIPFRLWHHYLPWGSPLITIKHRFSSTLWPFHSPPSPTVARACSPRNAAAHCPPMVPKGVTAPRAGEIDWLHRGEGGRGVNLMAIDRQRTTTGRALTNPPPLELNWHIPTVTARASGVTRLHTRYTAVAHRHSAIPSIDTAALNTHRSGVVE